MKLTIIYSELDKIRKKIAQYQSKAKKLKVDYHTSLKLLSEPYSKEMNQGIIDYVSDLFPIHKSKRVAVKVIDIEVEGEMFALNDWMVVGAVEKLKGKKENNTIISIFMDDIEVDYSEFKNFKNICEHCNTKRDRNSIYILQNKNDSSRLLVGKSCLKDFTGHASPELIAQALRYLQTITIGDEYFKIPRMRVEIYLKEVLFSATLQVKHHGYVTGEASERNKTPSTKEAVIEYFKSDTKVKLPEKLVKEIEKEVEGTIKYYQQIKPKSMFEQNMQALSEMKTIPQDKIGIACYMVEGYRKMLARQAEQTRREQEQRKMKDTSKHFGEIKKRYSRPLLLIRTNFLGSGQFGDSYVHTFKDEDENIFSWFTSKDGEAIMEGKDSKEFNMWKFTVKDFDEWKEIKQTKITRAKIQDETSNKPSKKKRNPGQKESLNEKEITLINDIIENDNVLLRDLMDKDEIKVANGLVKKGILHKGTSEGKRNLVQFSVIDTEILDTDSYLENPRRKKTRRRKDELPNEVGYGKNKKMNDEVYALKRAVMNIIYEVKSEIPNLPRITVRITENHQGEKAHVVGTGTMDKRVVIWFPEQLVKKYKKLNYLRFRAIVLHEIGHAAFKLKHDEKCVIMAPVLKRTPSEIEQAQFIQKLKKLSSKFKRKKDLII